MRIGIDLDDTQNTLVNKWIARYNRDWKDNVSFDSIKTWEIADFINPMAKSAMFAYLREPGFFYDGMQLQKGVNDMLSYLKSLNHKLYTVTAYLPEACLDKARFIDDNIPEMESKDIIFCNDKSVVNVDVLIDDGQHNFNGFEGIKIIYTKPWNKDFDGADYRIDSLEDIKKIKLFKESV